MTDMLGIIMRFAYIAASASLFNFNYSVGALSLRKNDEVSKLLKALYNDYTKTVSDWKSLSE